ncbi:MAG: phosphate acetyltransferase [Candidatus Sumerlaeia bacterium]|nr:phosphate acetyltransferase [Candidatus Sumerlaeia bacterium]
MNVVEKIVTKAKERKKRIAIPEAGIDTRVIQAARKTADQGWANPILIGRPSDIQKVAQEAGVNVSDLAQVDHTTDPRLGDFADEYNVIRRKENLSKEQALELFKDPFYFAAMLLHKNYVDGICGGAATATADVLRPSIKIVGMKPGIKTVSSCFIMVVPNCVLGGDGVYIFADCAVLPDPTAEQLADIAIASADTAKTLIDFDPRIAMLSFSTKGSAEHPMVDKVRKATALVKERRPDLPVDGELQADAAIVESVGKRKAPGSPIAGKANVLIFPDLNSANIGYKLVQRFTNCDALGPIIQGLAQPVNDLSRGASVDEIAITNAMVAALA